MEKASNSSDALATRNDYSNELPQWLTLKHFPVLGPFIIFPQVVQLFVEYIRQTYVLPLVERRAQAYIYRCWLDMLLRYETVRILCYLLIRTLEVNTWTSNMKHVEPGCEYVPIKSLITYNQEACIQACVPNLLQIGLPIFWITQCYPFFQHVYLACCAWRREPKPVGNVIFLRYDINRGQFIVISQRS